jgi:RAQPRD family integrative conjugative element protein
MSHRRYVFGLIVGLVLTPALQADPDAEREALANILHELSVVESLIGKAEAGADGDARVRFQYQWLRQDLDQVKAGIQSHLNAPRTQPRPFPPLRGDYRR